MAFVRTAWEERRIYSNGMDAISFWLGEAPLSLPMKSIPFTTSLNMNFFKELERLCQDVRDNGAHVVIFDEVNRRYLAGEEDIARLCGLHLIHGFSDGRVYGAAAASGKGKDP